jgi:hypothetical protein
VRSGLIQAVAIVPSSVHILQFNPGDHAQRVYERIDVRIQSLKTHDFRISRYDSSCPLK